MKDAARLRALASWYREFAERTANPTIWECRILTAEDLEAEADRIEGHERPSPEADSDCDMAAAREDLAPPAAGAAALPGERGA